MLSLLVTNKRQSHFRKRWATIEVRRELEMSHHTTQFRRRSQLPLRHKVFNNDNERNSVDTTSFGEHHTMVQEIRARLTLAPEIHIHKLSQQQQRIFHINQIIFRHSKQVENVYQIIRQLSRTTVVLQSLLWVPVMQNIYYFF